VAVKVTEGTAEFIFGQLRTAIVSRLRYRLAALVLRPALMAMRRRMDYGEYGGAPLLGVDGVVIVSHGRADGIAIKNGVRLAREAAGSGMLDALRGAFAGERDGAKAAASAPSSPDAARA
jgi:glycerol-3-phosphate acyltransferase PlsX